MILGRPTEYGTGIEIFGDYWDLKSLYNTVHFFTGIEAAGANGHLLEFAYDIRKTNSNQS